MWYSNQRDACFIDQVVSEQIQPHSIGWLKAFVIRDGSVYIIAQSYMEPRLFTFRVKPDSVARMEPIAQWLGRYPRLHRMVCKGKQVIALITVNGSTGSDEVDYLCFLPLTTSKQGLVASVTEEGADLFHLHRKMGEQVTYLDSSGYRVLLARTTQRRYMGIDPPNARRFITYRLELATYDPTSSRWDIAWLQTPPELDLCSLLRPYQSGMPGIQGTFLFDERTGIVVIKLADGTAHIISYV